MRPLRLKMTGFGPYKETNIIDMESLGHGGLYLITGDTGAGKTFIFDAITYALYGEMSGSGRDIKSVRSQYSPDGEKTEVELIFEYRGRRYTVTRNPEYYRAKKSGEGLTKQTAGATLIKPDGSVTDGTSRVNEEIRSILGIDRGQFCSIAMIAQGEFRKVLTAGTDERQKLFRKLFNTQAYSRLSDELKELNRKNTEKYNDCLHAMELCLSSVSCSFNEELSRELDELRESAENDTVMYEEICSLIENVIRCGEEVSGSMTGELTEIEGRLTGLNNIIALAENHRENVLSLEKARRGATALDQRIEDANKELNEAGKKKPLIGKLENEAALLEASMDSYDELDSISAERAKLDKELENKESEISETQTKAETLKQKLEDSSAQLEELKSSGEELIKVSNVIEKTESRVRMLCSLAEEIKEVYELSDTLKQQQDDLEPVLADAEKLEGEHSSMVSAYMREQAGILAASLKEGEQCPVCGSVHHPLPAPLDKDAPSADDIEEKFKEAKNARAEASRLMGEANKTNGRLSALMISACDAAKRETGTEDLRSAESMVRDEIASLNETACKLREEEKQLKEKSETADTLQAELPDMRRSFENMNSNVRDLEKEISLLKASIAAVKARYDQVKKDLAYDSKEEAERFRTLKAEEARKLREEIEEAVKAVNKAVSDKRANDAGISELEKVVAGYEPVDEEQAEKAAAEAEAERELIKEKSILISSELRSARAALKAVNEGAGELERIRREHEMIDSLSRTANGSLPGKERITLEAYVQSFYFERIIRRANVRLRMMSDGQYEFVRSDVSGDKRHLSGLDLSVLDHYSGSSRPVSTLSGGESFMASLSLALGLSDEVQASAGGIRMDTMFVDEGFGSLDSETLSKAIRTLTELSDEDRLVGIISHVDALKSRIDRQISVTKDRDKGSRAVVII